MGWVRLGVVVRVLVSGEVDANQVQSKYIKAKEGETLDGECEW